MVVCGWWWLWWWWCVCVGGGGGVWRGEAGPPFNDVRVDCDHAPRALSVRGAVPGRALGHKHGRTPGVETGGFEQLGGEVGLQMCRTT